MYALLSYLSWQVIQLWPDEPVRRMSRPAPMLPFTVPDWSYRAESESLRPPRGWRFPRIRAADGRRGSV